MSETLSAISPLTHTRRSNKQRWENRVRLEEMLNSARLCLHRQPKHLRGFTHESNLRQTSAENHPKTSTSTHAHRLQSPCTMTTVSIAFGSSSHNSDNTSVQLGTRTHLGDASVVGGWLSFLNANSPGESEPNTSDNIRRTEQTGNWAVEQAAANRMSRHLHESNPQTCYTQWQKYHHQWLFRSIINSSLFFHLTWDGLDQLSEMTPGALGEKLQTPKPKLSHSL